MHKRWIVITIIMMCFIVGAAHSDEKAENNSDDKQKQDMFKTYKKMSRGGYAMEVALLNRIEYEFDKMDYTADDKELVQVLIYLSEEGVLRREYVGGRLSNDNFDIRIRSVRLLTKLGGDDACNAICRLLCHEMNINVLSVIFDAFVDIPDNEDGTIMESILQSYRNQVRPEHTYLLSMMRCLKYVIGSNDKSYNQSIDLLKEIINREDVRDIVKNEANNEMKILRQFRESSNWD
ncbi:MAG: hypothetical protein J6W76_01825 [Spirochaetales bacterium]|nr:hypothetical protein [Spirochaetales bacterium]